MIVLSRSKNAAGRPHGFDPARVRSGGGRRPGEAVRSPAYGSATSGKGRATIEEHSRSRSRIFRHLTWRLSSQTSDGIPPSRRRGPRSSPQEPGPCGPWSSPRPGAAPFRGAPAVPVHSRRRRAAVHSRYDARGRPAAAGSTGRGMTSAPALLVTRDELLLDDLLRLAAAAGIDARRRARHHQRAARLGRGVRGAARRRPGRPVLAAAAPAAARRRCTSSATGRARTALFRSALAGRRRRRGRAARRASVARRAARPTSRTGAVRRGADRSAWWPGRAAPAPPRSPRALALTAAPRAARRARRPRPARRRASTGSSASRPGDAACAGTRWSARTRAARVARRCGPRSRHAGRSAVLTWAAPRPRGPLDAARCARCSPRRSAATTWWSSTCRGRLRRGDRGGGVPLRRGAGGGRADGRGRVAAGRVPARCARSPARSGWWSAARRRVRPRRRRGALGSRCSRRCRDQRRLAEHVDLGLGPVHPRRGPLARAAAGGAGRGCPSRRRSLTAGGRAAAGRRARRGPRAAGPRAARP